MKPGARRGEPSATEVTPHPEPNFVSANDLGEIGHTMFGTGDRDAVLIGRNKFVRDIPATYLRERRW